MGTAIIECAGYLNENAAFYVDGELYGASTLGSNDLYWYSYHQL